MSFQLPVVFDCKYVTLKTVAIGKYENKKSFRVGESKSYINKRLKKFRDIKKSFLYHWYSI